jgi:hypothetical protein
MKEKSSGNKDDRSCRVWFSPKGGWEEVKSVLKKKADLETENWRDLCNKDYKADIEKSVPHIFLSRSPLTFGHSQLVIPSPPWRTDKKPISETSFFEIASVIIVRALQTYQQIFSTKGSLIHEENTFRALAESTYSYGQYIKTLVVRASAEEKAGKQYKVHLVPYLKSHEAECLKRFRAQHRVKPDKKGGLIGWLGDRETEVDKWESEWCWPDVSHNDIVNEVWNLPQLASRLNQRWFKKYQSVVKKA